MAAAYRARIHGRRDEEGRLRSRIIQIGGRGADVPPYQIILAFSNWPVPAPAGTGFLALGASSATKIGEYGHLRFAHAKVRQVAYLWALSRSAAVISFGPAEGPIEFAGARQRDAARISSYPLCMAWVSSQTWLSLGWQVAMNMVLPPGAEAPDLPLLIATACMILPAPGTPPWPPKSPIAPPWLPPSSPWPRVPSPIVPPWVPPGAPWPPSGPVALPPPPPYRGPVTLNSGYYVISGQARLPL